MSSTQDFAASGADDSSPIAQANNGGRFNEEFEASQRGSSLIEGVDGNPQRTNSTMSQSQTVTPSRGGTLKKRNSLKKSASIRRSTSRRSLGAGSVKSLGLGDREKYEGSDFLSAFSTPVPTKGSPTDILANRFQGELPGLSLAFIGTDSPARLETCSERPNSLLPRGAKVSRCAL
jgi:hypothetical protein